MEAESVVTMEVAKKPEDAAAMKAKSTGSMVDRYIAMHHQHDPKEHQCSSNFVKHIFKAPIDIVWSIVRKFDQPQIYKPFIEDCITGEGHLRIGSIRHVSLMSGLIIGSTSTEMLERIDEEQHILGFRVVGGDHVLQNYSSIISLHKEEIDGREGTLAIESFVVDVPEGNSIEDTCNFVRTLINCNMRTLLVVANRIRMRIQAGLPAVV